MKINNKEYTDEQIISILQKEEEVLKLKLEIELDNQKDNIYNNIYKLIYKDLKLNNYNIYNNIFKYLLKLKNDNGLYNEYSLLLIEKLLDSNLNEEEKNLILNALNSQNIFEVILSDSQKINDYYNDINDLKYNESYLNDTLRLLRFVNLNATKVNQILGEDKLKTRKDLNQNTYPFDVKVLEKITSELPSKKAMNFFSINKNYSHINIIRNNIVNYINKDVTKENKINNNNYADDLVVAYFQNVINTIICNEEYDKLIEQDPLLCIMGAMNRESFKSRNVYKIIKDRIDRIKPLFDKALEQSLINDYSYNPSSVNKEYTNYEYYIEVILFDKFNQKSKTNFLHDPFLKTIISIVKNENFENKILKDIVVTSLKGCSIVDNDKQINMYDYIINLKYEESFNKWLENDSIDKIIKKSSEAYYKGEVIPYEVAKRIIKQHILGLDPHVTENALKSAFCSIAYNKVTSNNHHHIFYTELAKEKNGVEEYKSKTIKINNKRFEEFFNNTKNFKQLFEENGYDSIILFNNVLTTLYHELEHANQMNNVYLNKSNTFENLIITIDELNKTDENYKKDYSKYSYEAMARKASIKDMFVLLKEILGSEIAKSYLEIVKGKIAKENQVLLDFTRMDGMLFDVLNKKINEETIIEYPVLKNLYNDNCVPKTILEIIDYVDKDNNSNKYNMLYNILKYKVLYADINTLAEYTTIMNYAGEDNKIKEIINYYLTKDEKEGTIINKIFSMIDKFELDSLEDDEISNVNIKYVSEQLLKLKEKYNIGKIDNYLQKLSCLKIKSK